MEALAACRNDMATVEAQLLARMDDAERRNDALGGFVRFEGPDKPSTFEMKLRRVMEAVRSAPAIQSKLKEYGRPVSFAGTRAYWGEY